MEDISETRKLLAAALIARSGNRQLLVLAKGFALSPPWEQYLSPTQSLSPIEAPSPQTTQLSEDERLERKIHELDSDIDVVQWRKRLEQLERQICRVEVQTSRGPIYGTGFLLGPDMIMTNYHVVKEVIDGPLPSHKVKFYFDYKLDEDGKTQSQGETYELAEDWHIYHSESSDQDLKKHEHIVDVEAYKLDFALLRLKGSPGTAPNKDNKQTERGWIALPREEYDF